MNAPAPDPGFFHTEATMAPESPCYVTRPADAELLVALRERKLTVILSSRKVGKSSLIERAFDALAREGVCTAKHELTQADAHVTVEGWYGGLINGLVQDASDRNPGFSIDAGWWEWWQGRASLPPGERLRDFVRVFFLEQSDHPWVFAIDEIDTTIPLPFTDDFFAAIRACENARATKDSPFRRLTFLLAGVATPSQLMKDRRRTPFNVGTQIEITDFAAGDARILLAGLGQPEDAEHPALVRVLHWTGGHPYLTQRVFAVLASQLERDTPPAPDQWHDLVDEVVRDTFLQPGKRRTEAHLDDIARRRIGDLADRRLKRAILLVWRDALRGRSIQDDALSIPLTELKLCGLLVSDPADGAKLVARNRIYRAVLDERWVGEVLPRNAPVWIASSSVVAACLAVAAFFVQREGALQERIDFLRRQIELAGETVPIDAHSELKAIEGKAELADELLVEYWKKQARLASVQRPRDEAALLWLTALSVREDAEARLQARRAIQGGLSRVISTFRHNDLIRHVTFSADGRRVMTTSDDQTARVWDARTGRPLGDPLHHLGGNWHAVFSPNGRWVAKASDSITARVWDAETLRPVSQPMRHRRTITHLAFSRDGLRVVTASDDDTARVWDAETGLPVTDPLLHRLTVLHATFSADGRRVVTASSDNTARVWDAKTGRPVSEPMQHLDKVWFAAFSPDGRRVVTASSDNTARVWDAETGLPVGEPLAHRGIVMQATFSPDGRRVVTASSDDKAQIWDVETGQVLGEPMRHLSSVSRAIFSSDGRRVATASNDFTARVWDAETGRPVCEPLQHYGQIEDVAFSPDGRWVVTASEDGTARVWELQTDWPLSELLQHSSSILHATFSPDGQRVVTASEDRTARVWNAETGRPVSVPLQHAGDVLHAAFSPDGRRVVTASDDKTARVWSAETGLPMGEPLLHMGGVLRVAFSPDGRRVVTASDDNTARVWDAETARPVNVPLRHIGHVRHAMFSPDGQRVVTASDDATAQIWDVETGLPVCAPLRHLARVLFATFSPDGRWVVTASSDDTARVWDAQTGRPIGEPLQHDVAVDHATFSPDGRRVVTVSLNNAARVWDAETGRPLGELLQYRFSVLHAAFNSDGRRVITDSSHTNTIWSEDRGGLFIPTATLWRNGLGSDRERSQAGWLFGTARALSSDGESVVRIIEGWTRDAVFVRSYSASPGEEGLPELGGPAASVLEKYLQRFSLAFAKEPNSIREKSALVPKFLTEVRRSPTISGVRAIDDR